MEHYKGFEIKLHGLQSLLVYKGRQIVWEELSHHDGESGWKKCRQWIDENGHKYDELGNLKSD